MIFRLDRGSNLSWSIPITYGPLAASVVLFAFFVFVEMKLAAEPFAPGHIIFERTLFACYMCNFFSFGSWLAGLYYLPLFFQAVDGLGATGAALRLLFAITAGVSGSLFGGIVMRKTGKYYWLTVVAYTMLMVGLAVIFLFSGVIINTLYGLAVGMMFAGFGNGVGVTTSLIALSKFFRLHVLSVVPRWIALPPSFAWKGIVKEADSNSFQLIPFPHTWFRHRHIAHLLRHPTSAPKGPPKSLGQRQGSGKDCAEGPEEPGYYQES